MRQKAEPATAIQFSKNHLLHGPLCSVQ